MMDAAPPNRNPRRSPPLDFREDVGDILASCPAFGNAGDEAVVTDADDAPRNKATIVEGANVSLGRAMSSTPTVRKMRDPHCLRVSFRRKTSTVKTPVVITLNCWTATRAEDGRKPPAMTLNWFWRL